MSQGKRLLALIFINVVVSAVTTYAVLSLWSQSHPSPVIPTGMIAITPDLPTGTQLADSTSQPVDTLAAPIPVNQVVIAIDNIFGVNNLANEVVLIKSKTDASLSLTNWHLEDNTGNVYTFPELTLNKGGAVQVHTSAGVSTVIDLYWGRDKAVWQTGKVATLIDSQGVERAQYTVP